MICGKTIYVNRQQAMQAINGIRNNIRIYQQSKSYFCDACNGWHVTTEGKGSGKSTGKTRKEKFKENLRTKPSPDKQVIGRSQAPLIIHDIRKFKVK